MRSSKIKYLYILSQRYSGSTLLSFLLATHPEISTIGERRKFFNKSIRPDGVGNADCSCGKTFDQCSYWNAIKNQTLTKVREQNLETNLNSTEFRLSGNKYLNALATRLSDFAILNNWPAPLIPYYKVLMKQRHFNLILIESILDLDGNRVFLDSSKSMRHAMLLSQMKEFQFYIIWLRRDPRAQIHSALKYNNWSIEKASRKWVREMEHNEKVLKKLTLNHINVRYEDLCKQPEIQIERILDFIGLDPRGYSLDFRAREQHIMGNYSMRLGKENKILERQEWKSSLSKKEQNTIAKITNSVLWMGTNS